MDDKASAGDGHPDAIEARNLQEAVNRLKEQVREALAKGLNPELVEDLHWSIARIVGQINDRFRSGG